MDAITQVGALVVPATGWQGYVDEVTNNLTFKTRALYHQDPGKVCIVPTSHSRIEPGHYTNIRALCASGQIQLFPVI